MSLLLPYDTGRGPHVGGEWMDREGRCTTAPRGGAEHLGGRNAESDGIVEESGGPGVPSIDRQECASVRDQGGGQLGAGRV